MGLKYISTGSGELDESEANLLYLRLNGGNIMTGAYQSDQISTPSSPAAGDNKLYFKSGDKVYTLNSAGTEAALATETFLAANHYTQTELDAGQLDGQYFQESEHLNTSAGAGDAGKPIKLDASGLVNANMLPASVGDFFKDGSVAMTGNFDLDGNDIVSTTATSVITNSNTNLVFETDGSLSIDGANFIGPNSGPTFSLILGAAPAALTGVSNTVLGTINCALTSGSSNISIGVGAGQTITAGNNNTCIGAGAGRDITTGGAVFIGANAGRDLTTGAFNVVIGHDAMLLSSNPAAKEMVVVGHLAGNLSSGTKSLYLGSQVGTFATGSSNLYIGNLATGRESTGNGNILLCPGASTAPFYGLSATAATKEMAVGSPGSRIENIYWGKGGSSPTPVGITHRATNASGTDVAGVDFSIAAGQPTGDADSGNILLKTIFGGSTGATVQTAVERFKVDSKGSVSVGTAALATDATDGFFYIPSSAGVPTGAPTAKTGLVAMHYDSTNNKFYIYNGSWRSVAVA